VACTRLLVRKTSSTEFAELPAINNSDTSLCSFSEEQSAECDTLEFLRCRR